jgi:hypothetical protein
MWGPQLRERKGGEADCDTAGRWELLGDLLREAELGSQAVFARLRKGEGKQGAGLVCCRPRVWVRKAQRAGLGVGREGLTCPVAAQVCVFSCLILDSCEALC